MTTGRIRYRYRLSANQIRSSANSASLSRGNVSTADWSSFPSAIRWEALQHYLARASSIEQRYDVLDLLAKRPSMTSETLLCPGRGRLSARSSWKVQNCSKGAGTTPGMSDNGVTVYDDCSLLLLDRRSKVLLRHKIRCRTPTGLLCSRVALWETWSR